MNMNDVAKEISKREKGKREVDIAQIKEILRVLGDMLQEMTLYDRMRLINKMVNLSYRRKKNV